MDSWIEMPPIWRSHETGTDFDSVIIIMFVSIDFNKKVEIVFHKEQLIRHKYNAIMIGMHEQ